MKKQILVPGVCFSLLTLTACGSGGSDSPEPLTAPNAIAPIMSGGGGSSKAPSASAPAPAPSTGTAAASAPAPASAMPAPSNPLPAPSNPAPSNPVPEQGGSEQAGAEQDSAGDSTATGSASASLFVSNDLIDQSQLREADNAAANAFRLGVQVSAISHDMTAWMLNDVMKTAGLPGQDMTQHAHSWGFEQNGKSISDEPGNIAVDADGWPVSLTLADGSQADALYTKVMTSAVPEAYEVGEYTLTFDGEGSIEIDNADVLSQSASGLTLYYPGSGALTVRITHTDPNNTGNYVRNIQLLRPNADGQLFSQPYLNFVAPASTLRTASLMSPALLYAQGDDHNAVTGLSGWQNRARLTSGAWGTSQGAPYEMMAALANQSGSHLWLNLPLAADDVYIEALAELLYQELDSSRSLYIELGNELAKRSFPQRDGRDYALAQAHTRWPGAQQLDAVAAMPLLQQENLLIANWQAARTLEIQTIFAQVWGKNAERVQTVLAGALHDSHTDHSYNRMLLDGFLITELENGQAPGTAVDVLAVDPLVADTAATQFSTDNADTLLLDVLQYVDGTGRFGASDYAPGLRYQVRHAADLAYQYGLALTAYAGGHRFSASSYLHFQALEHVQMYDVFEGIFSMWEEENGGAFIVGQGIAGVVMPEYCNSPGSVPVNRRATVGLKSTQQQNDDQAPMYRAYQDQMRALGQMK